MKALKRSGVGWPRLVEETEEGLEDVAAVFKLLPAAPGLHGEGGSVTLGLLGGESVAGGDRAPAGTPMAL